MYPAAIIVLTLLIVVLLDNSRAQVQSACGDHATQERVRGMMLSATDDAFEEHIANLHGVWMRDDNGQPQRAATGVIRGVAAYLHARKAIAEWSLKPC